MSATSPTTTIDPELLWKAEYKYFSLRRKKENDDTAFFKAHPEWFAYMVIGRKLLLRMSKSRQFQRLTKFQVDFLLSFLDPHIFKMFVVANRGGAKSFLLALCCALDISINPDMEISLLAGSEEQANRVFNYARRLLTDPLSGATSLVKRDTANEIEMENGSFLYRLAASATSTRGPRGDKLVVDEITQIKSSILTGFFGQAITSPEFKLACAGTPDDPTHMAFQWWCSPPRENIHHWYNIDSAFHLYHWNAMDCLIQNGGWIYPETLEAMKSLYGSRLDYRREILGLWTSQHGSILQLDDIEAATQDFRQSDLPDPSVLDGMIISVDGARHSHYATIVATGYMNHRAYVYFAKGWDDCNEDKLRRRIMNLARHYKQNCKVTIIIEDAPISVSLIDNVKEECIIENLHFFKSRFGNEKNRFVDSVCGFFENHTIKIPSEYMQLINELFMWRWATNGKPEKGNDDFIDALTHNLHNTRKIYYEDHGKAHTGYKKREGGGSAVRFFNSANTRRRTGFGNNDLGF